ncbi:hypothetical protein CPB84DRAFT_1749419 [Gymnopilus junonius]|uniref:Uncharacterized protein n=1 Tax=Gymnopilus junonius TaxID=109634 RepID=A0A9P5NHP6_GYMJU|nr:hypothetical protein CPB84DRAFT_1749419 [Gymnopilus junonius]
MSEVANLLGGPKMSDWIVPRIPKTRDSWGPLLAQLCPSPSLSPAWVQQIMVTNFKLHSSSAFCFYKVEVLVPSVMKEAYDSICKRHALGSIHMDILPSIVIWIPEPILLAAVMANINQLILWSPKRFKIKQEMRTMLRGHKMRIYLHLAWGAHRQTDEKSTGGGSSDKAMIILACYIPIGKLKVAVGATVWLL